MFAVQCFNVIHIFKSFVLKMHTSPKTLRDKFIISPAVMYIGWLDIKIIIKSLPASLFFILYHCIVQACIPTFLACNRNLLFND